MVIVIPSLTYHDRLQTRITDQIQITDRDYISGLLIWITDPDYGLKIADLDY